MGYKSFGGGLGLAFTGNNIDARMSYGAGGYARDVTGNTNTDVSGVSGEVIFFLLPFI